MTHRVLRGRMLTAALLLASAAGIAHAQTTALVNRLEAAVVSKLPQFVEWPPAVFAGRTTLDLCVGGHDPVGAELQQLVAGETINGRQLVAREVAREQEIAGCQLLYLPSRPARGPHPFLRRRSRSRF